MKFLIGKIAYYFIREPLNSLRWWLFDDDHDYLMMIISWLDKKPSVEYWRKKDRGV